MQSRCLLSSSPCWRTQDRLPVVVIVLIPHLPLHQQQQIYRRGIVQSTQNMHVLRSGINQDSTWMQRPAAIKGLDRNNKSQKGSMMTFRFLGRHGTRRAEEQDTYHSRRLCRGSQIEQEENYPIYRAGAFTAQMRALFA